MTDIQTQYENLIWQALVENEKSWRSVPYPPGVSFHYNKWWVKGVLDYNYGALESLYDSLRRPQVL